MPSLSDLLEASKSGDDMGDEGDPKAAEKDALKAFWEAQSSGDLDAGLEAFDSLMALCGNEEPEGDEESPAHGKGLLMLLGKPKG